MPRGEKATNTGNKRPRARKIAESMRRRGATRAAANLVANAAMDREYSSKRTGNARKAKRAVDEEAHDSRSGQRKTNLTTKNPAVSGARKPSSAARAGTSKRLARAPGRTGKPTGGRKPRSAVTGTRAPRPRHPTQQRAQTTR